MGKTFRGFRPTNGRDSSRKSRDNYRRYDRNEQTGEISTYCALNLETGEVYNCKNMDHACAFGFGRNKRAQNHNWMVIYRGADCFITL